MLLTYYRITKKVGFYYLHNAILTHQHKSMHTRQGAGLLKDEEPM